jgi:hypothetical protein
MKKMLKRADGSTSQRGLWDNIRAKAASNKKAGKKGKAPSQAMLEQEAKIKAEMKMGGDWMQGSKELKFGGPTKYQTGKPKEEVASTPTYTKFTFTPTAETDKALGIKKDNFIRRTIDKISDRFASTAGGGNKGGGSTAFDKGCIGKDCGKVMKEKAGKKTNPQNQGGAPGLSSSKQLARGRVVDKSEAQIALEQKGIDERAANKAENEAEREIKRQANKAALDAEVAKINTPIGNGVYGNPRDLTPIRMNKNKTGGKKTYFKK